MSPLGDEQRGSVYDNQRRKLKFDEAPNRFRRLAATSAQTVCVQGNASLQSRGQARTLGSPVTSLAFDTHKAVKSLCDVGFDLKQAETLVDQINTAYNDTVATKADIATLPSREEFQSVKEDLQGVIRTMATKDELREVKEEIQATKDELRGVKEELLATMATKDELREVKEEIQATMATKDELEKLELRIKAEITMQSAKYQRLLFAFAAIVVGLTKFLDFLIG